MFTDPNKVPRGHLIEIIAKIIHIVEHEYDSTLDFLMACGVCHVLNINPYTEAGTQKLKILVSEIDKARNKLG